MCPILHAPGCVPLGTGRQSPVRAVYYGMHTTRERLPALVEADPTRSVVSLALELGVTPARVHQLLRAMGYRYVARWAKTAP